MPQQGSKKTAGRYRLYCNLGYNLNEETVRDYFQRFCIHGRILDVYIPRHSSGRNKGYGFTTFQHEADLENALQRAEHLIEGTLVKINRAGPRPEYQAETGQESGQLERAAAGSADSATFGKGPRLYVGGIPETISEEQILKHFQKWGEVLDIYFPGKRGHKRVNYCFVTFADWAAAKLAARETDFRIEGELVKAISVAEERAILPAQPQLLQGIGQLGALETQAFMLNQEAAGVGGGHGHNPLAAVQQQLTAQGLEHMLQSRDASTWRQLYPGAMSGMPPQVGSEPRTAHQQLLLNLQQQQYALQHQQQLLQQQLPDPLEAAPDLSMLHSNQPNLGPQGPPSSVAMPPSLMQELRAGVHDLRISPSSHLNIQGQRHQQPPYALPHRAEGVMGDVAAWDLAGALPSAEHRRQLMQLSGAQHSIERIPVLGQHILPQEGVQSSTASAQHSYT